MSTLTPYPPSHSLPTLRPLGTLTALYADGPSPGRLMAMVCDAAQRFLLAAESAMTAGWAAAAADNIRHAQGILLEILASAEWSAVPDVPDAATALAHLCQHLIDRLFEALAAQDVARIREARRLLTGLRDAWSSPSCA